MTGELRTTGAELGFFVAELDWGRGLDRYKHGGAGAAHYGERRRWASERRPVDDALLVGPLYWATTRYAVHIESLLARFAKDQLHVVGSEHLRAPESRPRTLAGIVRFLGVDDVWTSNAPLTEHSIGLPTRRWFSQCLATTRSWGALIGPEVESWALGA